MVTEEELKNRYTQFEEEIDARGRTIVVRRLKLSQQLEINEFTDKPINQMIFQVAASVQHFMSTEGHPVTMGLPKRKDLLLANIDLLGEEGMDAATKAYRRLYGLPALGEDGKVAAENDAR